MRERLLLASTHLLNMFHVKRHRMYIIVRSSYTGERPLLLAFDEILKEDIANRLN